MNDYRLADMSKTLLTLATAYFVSCSFLVAPADAASRWKGSSTNTIGTFNYGAVSFTVEGKQIKNFLIEGVTTSGCGGYKNVFVPRIRISGSKFSVAYRPLPGYDDVIRVSGRFNGATASGTFKEGNLCSNAGKFTARRR